MGEVAEAARAAADLAADQAAVFGPDHEDVLVCRNKCAFWISRLPGSTDEARALFRDLVPDLLRVLGPQDQLTLMARMTYAALLGRSGDHDAAAAESAQILEAALQVYGPDHPIPLCARGGT